MGHSIPSSKAAAAAELPAFTALADLASARVGGRALAANDDFFAPRSNLLKPEPAVFVPGKFTARGKWMDGWESRRRRTPGHDWCIVKLGMRSEEHTSELLSLAYLVCRLLLEKKNKKNLQ